MCSTHGRSFKMKHHFYVVHVLREHRQRGDVIFDRMRRGSVLVTVVAFVTSMVAGCTPKPDDVDPVVQDFFEAVSRNDMAAAAGMSDNSELAEQILSGSFSGLQAEGVGVSVDSVNASDQQATAKYTLTWDLPKDRSFSYSTEMNLSKSKGEWKVRWQPSVLHPKLGANQHLELRSLPAERANVVTADGASVLQPGTVYRLLIDPGKTDDLDTTVQRITQTLASVRAEDDSVPQVSAQKLTEDLQGRTSPYSVTMLSEAAGRAALQQLGDVPAVTFNQEAAMVRTEPSFAPDIVSRVEKIVNDDLEGANGWQIGAVNTHGALIDALETHAPKPAPAVRISLDHKVQQAAQKAVDTRQGMKAMMVAIRPSTGDILAIAQTETADEDGNIALMGQYPPGSTFKIITAAAGMQSEKMTPDTIVPCPGTMDIGNRIVTNYNQFSRGNVPLETAFAASCNTSFADISSRLKPGELKNYAKQFGLGVDYTIEGLDTLTGSVSGGDDIMDRVDAGFGQGHDLASPFGMALVAATAAAGKTPTPVLISGHETKVDTQVDPPSPEAIAALQQMMRSVVTSGTARGMQTGGEVHGKTGEAEISNGSHAWFTGYRDDIAFATLIVLGGGSQSAVSITDQFFKTLDQPDAATTSATGGVQ